MPIAQLQPPTEPTIIYWANSSLAERRGVAMRQSHLSATLGEKIMSVIAVVMLLAISVAVLMSLQYIHVYL